MTDILFDVNVNREVESKLSSLGYSTAYLTDMFKKSAPDEEIMRWIEKGDRYIVTRDKSFTDDDHRRVLLKGESVVKLARQALRGLVQREVYPEPLK